jgi:topoisomerase IA-like protein
LVSYKVVGPCGDDGGELLEPVTVLYPVSLGVHPATGGEVLVKSGPYGPYVEAGVYTRPLFSSS